MKDILSASVEESPWCHSVLHDAIDSDTLQELIQLFNQLDWNTADDAYEHGGPIKLNYNPHQVPSHLANANKFLTMLASEEFHKQVFDHYSVDYSNGYDMNLVFDKSDGDRSNQWHNDHDFSPNVITVMYYIQLDDITRTLKIKTTQGDEVDTNATAGSAVMFKSGLNTWHAYPSGYGQRLSVRLRLRTNMYSPTYIYNKDTSDTVGVIIDGKDWESGVKPIDMHKKLAVLTYENLIAHDFKNIIAVNSTRDFNTAVATLKSNGVSRILVLFNGGTVDNTTYDAILNLQSPYTGNVLSGNDRAARQYVVLNLNLISTEEFQVGGKYFGNVIAEFADVAPGDLGICILHPDPTTQSLMECLYYHDWESFEDSTRGVTDDISIAKELAKRYKDLFLNN